MINKQLVFDPIYYLPHRVLVVVTNGGSVTVEIKVGDDEWFLDSTVSEDSSKIIYQFGSTLRLTPTGGATYILE